MPTTKTRLNFLILLPSSIFFHVVFMYYPPVIIWSCPEHLFHLNWLGKHSGKQQVLSLLYCCCSLLVSFYRASQKFPCINMNSGSTREVIYSPHGPESSVAAEVMAVFYCHIPISTDLPGTY